MANPIADALDKSPVAQFAAQAFNQAVDHLVMQNLAKGAGINLGGQGISLASEGAANSLPSLGGGKGQGIA